MSTEDFIAYYTLKENNLTEEDTESEQVFRDKYYISDDEDLTAEEMRDMLINP